MWVRVLPRAAPARPPADIPKIAFEKYSLPNGLEVILSEDHRLPMVAVNLWYHVGPANEEAGRTGFAHLFEHMMFQGSKHVAGRLALSSCSKAPARATINGTTDFDRTNYFETLPSNQLELALWLESDRMGYLLDTLDQANLSNQQDVVRNERRQSIENVPYGIVEEEVYHQLFPKAIRTTPSDRLARRHPGREARGRRNGSSRCTTRRTTRASRSSATSTRPRAQGAGREVLRPAEARRRPCPKITATDAADHRASGARS